MEVLKGITQKIETFRNSERAFLTGASLVGVGEYTCIGTLAAGVARTLMTGESFLTYNPPEIALVAAVASGVSGFAVLGAHMIANRVDLTSNRSITI